MGESYWVLSPSLVSSPTRGWRNSHQVWFLHQLLSSELVFNDFTGIKVNKFAQIHFILLTGEIGDDLLKLTSR